MPDDIDPVAQLSKVIIGNTNAPDITELLRAFAGVLRGAHEAQDEFPKRDALRQRLTRISEAAALIAGEFQHRHTLGDDAAVLMMQAGGLDTTSINVIVRVLPELSEVAAAAAGRVDAGRGRHKTLPNANALTPHQKCAAIVSYCWNKARGVAPPPTSEEAQNSCEQLWKAAGLSRAAFGNTLSGWREHLTAVRDGNLENPPQSALGKAVSNEWHCLKQLDLSLIRQ